MNNLTLALQHIVAERHRQIEKEGWTDDHDDKHEEGALARAALSYLKHYVERRWIVANGMDSYREQPMPDEWPWAEHWWKPKNPRYDLVRASALVAAEIDRLDRASMAVNKVRE